jgi:hypothetical protein
VDRKDLAANVNDSLNKLLHPAPLCMFSCIAFSCMQANDSNKAPLNALVLLTGLWRVLYPD